MLIDYIKTTCCAFRYLDGSHVAIKINLFPSFNLSKLLSYIELYVRYK